MKKLIVSFAFVLIALTSYAQSSSEHLTFKGIPIEGSMTEFCQKLKAKGFTSIGSENNLALFMGDFTGRNATIGVTATDDGKSVFAVAVLFDPSGEWNTLVNTYGEFYQFNLSSCIRQQNSLTAQFVSFNLSNLANIFYPPQFLQ